LVQETLYMLYTMWTAFISEGKDGRTRLLLSRTVLSLVFLRR